ncbi:MAG: hypothetical protein HUK14_06015 [Muribaculaceae bacterium]|nr:hypothetical protein [Muribaculaceae bacterium]
MITSLTKLTMRQYVDLVCGDTSVLVSNAESVSEDKLQETRKRLLYEYAVMSDSAGTKIMLSEHERKQRAKAELALFKVLTNMLALAAFDDVRNILRAYGISRNLDDRQLADEVGRLLRRAKTNIARTNQKNDEDEKEPSPDEIRSRFDKQAASLMTYFKFQIDFNTIPASQFACMIDQANREIKAKMAALRKK